MAKKYLFNLTFYAGSDDPEDTDVATCVLTMDDRFANSYKMTSKKARALVVKLSRKANQLLDVYDYADPSEWKLRTSYENGLNVDTLIEGINELCEGLTVKDTNEKADVKIESIVGGLDLDKVVIASRAICENFANNGDNVSKELEGIDYFFVEQWQ